MYYFEANNTRDATRRRAALLSIVGPDTFKSQDVKKYHPDTRSRQCRITETLTDIIIMVHNFIILSDNHETQRLHTSPEFGELLNVMIQDRMVCRIDDSSMQKRLLAEGDELTLKKSSPDCTIDGNSYLMVCPCHPHSHHSLLGE